MPRGRSESINIVQKRGPSHLGGRRESDGSRTGILRRFFLIDEESQQFSRSKGRRKPLSGRPAQHLLFFPPSDDHHPATGGVGIMIMAA